MIAVHEDYIVGEDGKRKAVVIPAQEWDQILDELEELDELRAYDQAKNKASDPISFEEAVREIKEGKFG